eukprot:4991613-Karenia_brevis.AAC.1
MAVLVDMLRDVPHLGNNPLEFDIGMPRDNFYIGAASDISYPIGGAQTMTIGDCKTCAMDSLPAIPSDSISQH